MTREEIIERIKYIRKRSHLTQKALSKMLGMNPAYMNRLESKKDFEPSIRVLMNIIELCDSTPEEFFYHDIKEYEAMKEAVSAVDRLQAELLINRVNNSISPLLGIEVRLKRD